MPPVQLQPIEVDLVHAFEVGFPIPLEGASMKVDDAEYIPLSSSALAQRKIDSLEKRISAASAKAPKAAGCHLSLEAGRANMSIDFVLIEEGTIFVLFRRAHLDRYMMSTIVRQVHSAACSCPYLTEGSQQRCLPLRAMEKMMFCCASGAERRKSKDELLRDKQAQEWV